MNRFDAVVFDLDGTLIDSAPDLAAAVNRLLAEEARGPLDLARVTLMIGDGARKLVQRAFEASGPAAGERLDGLTARFLALYEGNAADETRAYDGVSETLARLAADGLALGVCTNKPEQPTRQILGELDLAPYFAAVVGGDTVPGLRKPDPGMVFAVLDRMGVAPARAAMVGDGANDVSAARAAGLPVIVRAGGYTATPADELGADAVIDTFDELPAALSRLP